MKIIINNAGMEQTEEHGFIGKVQFTVEQHKEPYEIVFHSKKGKDWGYALHFLNDSGPEEEIDALDQYLEQNDEAFDTLLQAAIDSIEPN